MDWPFLVVSKPSFANKQFIFRIKLFFSASTIVTNVYTGLSFENTCLVFELVWSDSFVKIVELYFPRAKLVVFDQRRSLEFKFLFGITNTNFDITNIIHFVY